MFRKNENGVTIISLVITIIMMLILASVTITSIVGRNSVVEDAADSNKILELQEVQQAVFETYIKYKRTENEEYIIGTKCNQELLEQYENEMNITLKDTTYNKYYLLNSQNLTKLGLNDSVDSYIVNYETGEVFNYTTKKTVDGRVLYITGKE